MSANEAPSAAKTKLVFLQFSFQIKIIYIFILSFFFFFS